MQLQSKSHTSRGGGGSIGTEKISFKSFSVFQTPCFAAARAPRPGSTITESPEMVGAKLVAGRITNKVSNPFQEWISRRESVRSITAPEKALRGAQRNFHNTSIGGATGAAVASFAGWCSLMSSRTPPGGAAGVSNSGEQPSESETRRLLERAVREVKPTLVLGKSHNTENHKS